MTIKYAYTGLKSYKLNMPADISNNKSEYVRGHMSADILGWNSLSNMSADISWNGNAKSPADYSR